MENASNALIMAAGVLVGILILSLAVYLFTTFGVTSAEIHKQNAQKQVVQFNSKFTIYEDKNDNTIYDVITVASYAKENNKYYEDNRTYKIEVKLNSISNLQDKLEDSNYKNSLIQADQTGINKENLELPTYKCQVQYDDNTGRVKVVSFTK